MCVHAFNILASKGKKKKQKSVLNVFWSSHQKKCLVQAIKKSVGYNLNSLFSYLYFVDIDNVSSSRGVHSSGKMMIIHENFFFFFLSK
jgi:hypothetical protein